MPHALALFIVLCAFIAYPVSRLSERMRTDKEIAERAKASAEWYKGFCEIYSSSKAYVLFRSFMKEHDVFAKEIEDDLRFVFGTDNPIALLNEQPFHKILISPTRDHTFRSPWHIVYQLYCAKAGVLVQNAYSLWDKGDWLHGGSKIILTKLQGFRACAMIERYLGDVYGQQKYLLFYDMTTPDWHTLKWSYRYENGVGERPW